MTPKFLPLGKAVGYVPLEGVAGDSSGGES
jgi:hypothetical protein